jgi:hypothetical protein
VSDEKTQGNPLLKFLKNLFGLIFLVFVLGVVALLLLGTLVPTYPKLEADDDAPALQPAESDNIRVVGLQCIECHNVLSDEAAVPLRAEFSHESHADAGLHCQECHDTSEHTYTAETATALCLECHPDEMAQGAQCAYCHEYPSTRQPPDHTSPDWLTVHGGQSISRVPSHTAELACASCHDEFSCQKCHALPMPHPAGYVTSHATMEVRWESGCGLCHEESYCINCHGSMAPASHSPKPFEHWEPAVLQASECDVCHRDPSYCSDCHTSAKPETHQPGWDHGSRALAIDSNCGFCHQQSYCADCHGLEMPHAENFVARHGDRSDLGTCSSCHQRSQCLDCHQAVYPVDHRQESWAQAHAEGDPDRCQWCHAKPVCADCHGGFEMPHPTEFLLDHGEPAYEKAKSCALCHQETEDCLQCHEALKPADHTEMFMMEHGERATDHLSYCYLCHTSESLCGGCHEEY